MVRKCGEIRKVALVFVVFAGLSNPLQGQDNPVPGGPATKTGEKTATAGKPSPAASNAAIKSPKLATKIADDPQLVFVENPKLSVDSSAAVAERVTDDPIHAAYCSFWIWKKAVEKAKSFDIDKVREALHGLEIDAPCGKLKVHESNQHVYKPVYIGRLKQNGQFTVIAATKALVEPQAYSAHLPRRGGVPSSTGGPRPGESDAQPDVTDKIVKVGILHSLSGTMAAQEASLKDAALFAIEEINKGGGVLGRKVIPVVEDPASDWPRFAEKARKLIIEDRVAMVEGCWTSVSRKVVLPVFEEFNSLLFYPVPYEGEEQSKNVLYMGSPPNQQIVIAAAYLLEHGRRRFFLLGTDYVFPRTANKVVRAYLNARGIPNEDITQEYTPFHSKDYRNIVDQIDKFAAGGKKACVISALWGDSNLPFFTEFFNAGLADECPIVSLSFAEDDLRGLNVLPMVDHLACWSYFQSLNTPANKKFVADFQAFCKRTELK